MVIDHHLDIPQDLTVPSVCLGPSLCEANGPPFEHAGRLGIEDEGDCEEAFDPFYEQRSARNGGPGGQCSGMRASLHELTQGELNCIHSRLSNPISPSATGTQER